MLSGIGHKVFTGMQQGVTVGEIAARLKGGPALVAKIRHWTREGLLQPRPMELRGTGRHRLYDPDTAYLACVLDVVSGMGVQIAAQGEHLKDALRMIRRELPKWLEARAAGQVRMLTLQMFFLAPGGVFIDVYDGPPKQNAFRAALTQIKEKRPHLAASEGTFVVSTTAINLGMLFDRVWKETRHSREAATGRGEAPAAKRA